jgi:hypothetical protein
MLWPKAATRRRWWRLFKRAPFGVQVTVAMAAALIAWLGLNWTYQVIRKPSELFFPVSGVLYKTPAETWRQYAPIFKQHSTATITPQLLAALAQIEASGNPVARTYWRWSLSHKPFEVYKPASSAVGMYQLTDGTFAEARRYCVHHHVVVEDGPWHQWRSCWFNSLYARVVPSHATEMTAAYLDRKVAAILSVQRVARASAQQQRQLATVIHLCGAAAGERFARRGLRPSAGQRCGDHDLRKYLQRTAAFERFFAGQLDE